MRINKLVEAALGSTPCRQRLSAYSHSTPLKKSDTLHLSYAMLSRIIAPISSALAGFFCLKRYAFSMGYVVPFYTRGMSGVQFC